MKKLFSFILTLIMAAVAAFAIGSFVEKTGFSKPEEPPVPVEITDMGSPYKFYYNDLNDNEKLAYNSILSQIYTLPESIQINEINNDELKRVFSALLSDNPDLFFVGRKSVLTKTDNVFTFIKKESKTSFSVDYSVNSRDEYNEMLACINAACRKVLENVDDSWTDWEKEKYVHDYIVDNCRYVHNEKDYLYSSAYGVLVNGEASCEGYAKAAKMLLDKLGIENGVVSGTAYDESGNPSPHMWNAVNVDGEWYHLDCTWDDPVGEQTKSYFYFNLNDKRIALTHSDFSRDYGCTGNEGYYFIKKGLYFESYGRSGEERLAKLIAEALENGEEYIDIQFSDKASYDAAFNDLINNERYYNVYLKTKEITDIKFKENATNYATYEERFVIRLSPIFD